MNEFINELFESVEAGELTSEDAMTIVEAFGDSDDEGSTEEVTENNDDVVEEAANDDIKKILDDIKDSFDENSEEYNKCIKYREFSKAEDLAKKMGKDIDDAKKAIAAISDDTFSIATGAIGSFIKGAATPLAIGASATYSITGAVKNHERYSRIYLKTAKYNNTRLGGKELAKEYLNDAKDQRAKAKEGKKNAEIAAALTGAASLGSGIVKSIADVKKNFKDTGSKNITRTKVNSALDTLKAATVNMERRAAMLKKLYRKTINISSDKIDEM